MNKADIIEALKQLDVEADGHWTTDGMPRLDVLQQKFPGLTRQLITSVAPLFSRKKPELPDLDAIREAAELAALEATEAARLADEKTAAATKAARVVQNLETPLHDRHALTRANQGWHKSQLNEDLKRAARQQALDAVLGPAGGMTNVGAHPVERAIAARVVTARKNIVVNTKPAEQAEGSK